MIYIDDIIIGDIISIDQTSKYISIDLSFDVTIFFN